MTTYYTSSAASGGGDGSLNNPWTLQEALDSAVGGDEVRVLNDGTYTPAATLDVDAQTGSASAFVTFIGRASDDSAYEQATISGSGMGAGSHILVIGTTVARYYRLKHLRLTAAQGDGMRPSSSWHNYPHIHCEQCRFDNCASYGFRALFSSNWFFYLCEFDHNVTGMDTYGTTLIGCRIHHNSHQGIDALGYPVTCFGCLIYRNLGTGIASLGASNCLVNSVFYANGGSGIVWAAATPGDSANLIANNMFVGNGAYGMNSLVGGRLRNFIDYNLFYDNSSGDFPAGCEYGEHNVTGQDPLFASVVDGAEDFTPAVGSPALGGGFPGTIPGWADGNASTGYMPMGALALDVAAVAAAAYVEGTGAGAAAQLADDQAAVGAAAAAILESATILGQAGSLPLASVLIADGGTLDLTAVEEAAAAAQLAADQADVTAGAAAILEGTSLLDVAGALDADLVLEAGGGTYVPAAEAVVAEGETYGAGGTQYTGTYDPLAGATGDEPEDVLAAVLAEIAEFEGLACREIHLLERDAFPAITIEREKSQGPGIGDFEPVVLRVGFWAKDGATTRGLARALPLEFVAGGWDFARTGRESGAGLPKPSRDEHACFTACLYTAKN